MLSLPLGPAVLNLRKDYRPGKAMECRTLDVVSANGRVWGCLKQTTDDPDEASDAWMLFFDIEAVVPKKYDLCEFYYFRHPTLKPGMQPAQGGLLTSASLGRPVPDVYPDAWEYLQTEEGRKLCKTEAEWQALTAAIWATLADGTKIGWNGIGGAPFYVQDLAAGTLRLPDLRGMYAEAAGYDALSVGGVHGDAGREIAASISIGAHYNAGSSGVVTIGGTGALYGQSTINATYLAMGSGTAVGTNRATFSAARVVPTAAKNQPRAWGALACVYLGQPVS